MLTAWYCNPSSATKATCITFAPFNVSIGSTGKILNPLTSNTKGTYYS